MKKTLTVAILTLWAVSLFAQPVSHPQSTIKSGRNAKSWNKQNTVFTKSAFLSLYDRLTRSMDIKLDSLVTSEYYSDENNWNPIEKYEYVYNDRNQIITGNYYTGYGEWTLDSKISYTYNENGDPENCIIYFMNERTQMMEYFSKVEYFYNENNLRDSVLQYFWNIPGGWDKEAKSVYRYNSDNRLIEQINFRISYNVEEENSKLQNIYDGENIVSKTWFSWEGEWLEENKCVFTYEEGRIIGWDEWEFTGSEWYEFYRCVLEYNQEGDVDMVKAYNQESEDEWLEEEIAIDYNTTYPIEKVILSDEFWSFTSYVPILHCLNGTLYKSFKEDGSLDGEEKTRFYYSPVSTVSVPTLEKPASRISLYPNPASTYVHVQTDLEGDIRCELYDLTGRNVRNTPVSGNGFSVEGIEPGIYVYKLIAGHHVESGKLIIR